LITLNASDEEIASLRKLFATFEDDQIQAHIDEYSETNIKFHQTILSLSKCRLLTDITANLFIHMRSIRARTISEANRANRSIVDHLHIIEALESRDTELAERLVREHTLNLATHVEKNVDYLE
jgi:DNA-binding GntR family transcriptional regulator